MNDMQSYKYDSNIRTLVHFVNIPVIFIFILDKDLNAYPCLNEQRTWNKAIISSFVPFVLEY